MAMDLETPVRSLLSPLGLSLYDLELVAGALNVVVSRDGGVDVDTLASASRAISAWLDEHDPIEGHYTLDVSSPGLERRLRTPEHFASAVGEVVTLREHRDNEPARRLEGAILRSDATTVTILDAQHGELTVKLDAVERARTVFHWGSETSSAKKPKASTASKKGK
ncbi:MAG: ribosome maturation factor RimP [Actinomycetales bacterium]|nr:ribosome maturation factor RimP [Actinomycetales bacterium]